LAIVNREQHAAVNGVGTRKAVSLLHSSNKENLNPMKQLVAALVLAAFSGVTLAQGTTPPASPPASSSSATGSTTMQAPAKSGTKKAKKKKAKKSTGAGNASASPTK
jgi:hypothetical protein